MTRPMKDKKDKELETTGDLQELKVLKKAEEVIQSLPEEERHLIQIALQSRFYSGPVMPPHLLSELENIIPGGANRVLQLTEKEQVHRHKIESTEQSIHTWQAKYSLIGGVISFIILVVGVVYCASHGFNWGTTSLAGIGAFGVISHMIKVPHFSIKPKK